MVVFVFFINRPAVLEYGMWDQIRVDHGNDFYLLLYFQEKMAYYRRNTRRAPFIQTMSKEVSLQSHFVSLQRTNVRVPVSRV